MHAKNQIESPNKGISVAYESVRERTVVLCKPLEIEDYVPQPIEDVSPPKWNIAHTTWFFEEMILKRYMDGYKEFDPRFGFLFNSYYNAIGDRTIRSQRGDLSRPTVAKVFEYRRHVDRHMSDFLQADFSLEIADLITLGINHEQQHQELFLADLKYSLGVSPLFPIYQDDFVLVEAGAGKSTGFISVDGGICEMGFEESGFHFDNELGRHKVYLDDFEIAKELVTNGQYSDFINDGGYRNHRLWHSEGWDWVTQNGKGAPLYWHKSDDGWDNFTLAGLRPLTLDSPVCHISFYEASAFAEWAGCRLPTEFEWEASSDEFNWGHRWEWTNSAYLPYPGFKTAEGAVGEYNGKFMINQMVLRGASVATTKGHSRKTYRNFFQPHLSWQFSGIRLARS